MIELGELRRITDFNIEKRVECKDGRVALRVTDTATGEDGVIVVTTVDGRLPEMGRFYSLDE